MNKAELVLMIEKNGFRLVGNTSPGAPIGNIYASNTLIIQKGIEKVLENVRDIYDLMWKNINE